MRFLGIRGSWDAPIDVITMEAVGCCIDPSTCWVGDLSFAGPPLKDQAALEGLVTGSGLACPAP
jgi:hypothetical protein